MNDLAYRAAETLLRLSRLRVDDLDDYLDDNGCGINWRRMQDERGWSSSEAALIGLAEDLLSGPLSNCGCFDDVNWRAVIKALEVLAGRPLPPPALSAVPPSRAA